MRFTTFLFLVIMFWLPSRGVGAQQFEGRVLNQAGEPLAFASILITPGNYSTITNEVGRYELQLPPGEYLIQIHFLGYNALQERFTIDAAYQQKDFVLERQVFELGEIRINANGEDPAYGIMRKAIQNAPLHLASVSSYQAKSYVKGSLIVEKAPWAIRKLMQRESLKVGTAYLLESVSELDYAYPSRFSEQVISIRSNLPPGSRSSISFANFNFYRSTVGEIISPLSPRAFANYRFVYKGAKVEGEQRLVRIGVTPRTNGPYLVEGDIYLLEPQFSIYSIDFSYVDDNGISYQLEQQYQGFETVWMPVKQDLKLRVDYLGATADIRYVTSVRDYRLQPNAEVLARLATQPKDVFDEGRTGNREARKKHANNRAAVAPEREDPAEPVFDYRYQIDSMARRQPDSLWKQLRQVPLEQQEIIGYRQADSIYDERREALLRDSIRALPIFKWYHPFTGNTYLYGDETEEFGHKQVLRYDGLFQGLIPRGDFFNTVEGVVLTSRLTYTQRSARFISTEMGIDLRYALARNRPLAQVFYTKRNHNNAFRFSGGTRISQLNSENPVPPLVNFLQTTFLNDNLFKLYEKQYAAIGWSRQLNMYFLVDVDAQFANRTPLQNNTRTSFLSFSARETISPNAPENIEMGATDFLAHQYGELKVDLQWQPWAVPVRINGTDQIVNRNRPFFNLKSTSGFSPSWYQMIEVGLTHNKSLQKGNSLYYQLNAGTFLRKPNYFLDYHHFNAFQSILQGNENRQFRNLSLYRFSTAGNYLSAFSRVQLGRLAISRFETARLLGLDEALFAAALVTEQVRHFEVGYNISGPFRVAGVDFFLSFNSLEPTRGGVRLRIGL